jgi:hypothetical protein
MFFFFLAKDLILNFLLKTNPSDRYTSEEALNHVFVSPFHDPYDEPTGEIIHSDIFDDENSNILKSISNLFKSFLFLNFK